jgi:hypothetical protein
MTIAIGQNQERGIFDLVDDWLKKDRFCFRWLVRFIIIPHCIFSSRWLVNRYNIRYIMVHTWFSNFIS